MNQWMTIAHLPSFWAQDWPVLAAIAALTTAAIIWLPKPIGRKSGERKRRELTRTGRMYLRSGQTREQYIDECVAQSADEGWAATIFIAFAVALVAVLATFAVHETTRNHTVANQIVDYVESTTDLTALSPIRIYDESAEFDAMHTDGAIAHVSVTWLPFSTHPYRTGTQLPTNVKAFTVDVHAKDTTKDSDHS